MPRMGHHCANMGHHFAQMGHKMGHKGTPTDIKMVSHVVMVKRQANSGLSARFLRAEWLKNRVKVAKTDPGPF